VLSPARACNRAGCSLQGFWTDVALCRACGFPTRDGEEAEYAVQKRLLLDTAGQGLEPGELPTSYGLVLRSSGVASHPGCGKVDACTVVTVRHLALRDGAAGTLTCGTNGLAFWTEDALSCRWPYEQIVSLIIVAGGAVEEADGPAAGGFSLDAIPAQLARLVNKLRGYSARYSFVDVVMQDSSVTFRTSSAPAPDLEQELAPALRRLRSHQ